MKTGWKYYFLYAVIIIGSVVFSFIIIQTIKAKSTGFETKTLWDWMELLIIPLVLAFGVFYLNRSERTIERQRTEERVKEERKLAEDRANIERRIAIDSQQEAALQGYLDRMADLLLREKLGDSKSKNKEVRNVARVRTLTLLRGLDKTRKGLVLHFLNEAALINKVNPIVSLEGADLQNADLHLAQLTDTFLFGANLQNADLSLAFLSNADLSFSKLQNANLQDASLDKAKLYNAHLNGANLIHADLSDADLSLADLSDADLSDANLEGVKVTELDLISAKSLKNAIMPDGTKHE